MEQFKNTFIATVDGSQCKNAKDLFRHFNTALQFPSYFGHNWDAFAECLSDLSWIKEPYVILVMYNTDDLLADEDESLLYDILGEAKGILMDQGKQLKLVRFY